MLDVVKIKNEFPIFKNYRERWGEELSFLDSAASSQIPRQVIESMNDYYFKYRSNVHRSPYKLGIEATEAYEEARTTVAKFIGAEKWEIIFTAGATMSVNMLTGMLERFLKPQKGDGVVVSVVEHHSNFIPFQELAKRTGAVFHIIPLHNDNLDYKQAEKLISKNTKIVAIPLTSNVLGTIYDVKRIVKLAKKIGAVSIIDATTAAGHILINVRDLECDFLYFGGHKMLGPTGIGILYGREELLNQLSPVLLGGGIITSVSEKETLYRDIPMRFEAGTPNIAGAIGLARAIKYIELLGIKNITEHCEKLVRYATKKLGKISNLEILSEKDERLNVGMVSFIIKGIHSQDVARILDSEHISIRAGHHCAMPLINRLGVPSICRASFHVYNHQVDIDRLADGIKRVKKLF